MLLAEISFIDVVWSMIIFFWFVMILWMIFAVFADIFRSDDLSGGMKAVWCIAIIVLPWLMIFIYLITRGRGMGERTVSQQRQAQAQLDDYVRQTAGASSPAEQIASAKQLLDSGSISQSEFDQLKQKALAA